jgi:hypothetical protein
MDVADMSDVHPLPLPLPRALTHTKCRYTGEDIPEGALAGLVAVVTGQQARWGTGRCVHVHKLGMLGV